MIVAGCDVGSTTGKAVIMKDHTIAAYTIIQCKPRPEETAHIAINEAMSKSAFPHWKSWTISSAPAMAG